MVGSAIVRLLRARGFTNLLLRTRAELDLCDAAAVRAFYEKHRPAYVFVAAAKVGGIWANATQPVEFLSENLQIELNLINGAHATGVKKLLFLGSSCIYPKLAPQPMTEDCLLTGSLEPTNEAYALAKICGIKLCQAYASQYGANFISAMPTNLYGPEDNFDLETSHVLPALIHKFHLAKEKAQPTRHALGHRQRLSRIPACRRSRRGLPFPHGKLRLARSSSTSAAARTSPSASWRSWSARSSAFPARSNGTHQARRHAAQASRCLQADQLGWKAKTPLEEGFARPINGGWRTVERSLVTRMLVVANGMRKFFSEAVGQVVISRHRRLIRVIALYSCYPGSTIFISSFCS